MKKKFANIVDQLSNSRYATLLQFIKFGIVGISNTLISYGIEMLGYYVVFAHSEWSERTKVILISAIAFFVSVTNSYYWNQRYVFKQGKRLKWQEHVKAYLKSVCCYGITGLVLSPFLKLLLVRVGMPYWMGSLLTLVITIPMNFIMNKFWAFRKHAEN